MIDLAHHHHDPKAPTIGDSIADDVAAIFQACARLVRGETIRCRSRKGERIEMRGVTLVVDGCEHDHADTYSMVVDAYGHMDFNEAWAAFEGRAR